MAYRYAALNGGSMESAYRRGVLIDWYVFVDFGITVYMNIVENPHKLWISLLASV